MIIGNGFIANLLKDLDAAELVIFASGVSNPECTSPEAFNREEDLLYFTILEHPNRIIVYFGTTTSRDSPYAKHKRRMEELIKRNAKYWCIIRVGPIKRNDGLGNTFYDFAYRRILNNEKFTVWKGETRPLLESDQFKRLVTHWLVGPSINTCISFEGFDTPVEEIVKDLEKKLNKKANYILG